LGNYCNLARKAIYEARRWLLFHGKVRNNVRRLDFYQDIIMF